MKINLVILLLLALPLIAFSQDAYSTNSLSPEQYLEKSQNQKGAGFLMFGGGSIMFLIGFSIYSDQGFNTGDEAFLLAGVGAGLVIASIPIYISGVRNARRAATLSLGNQPLLIPQHNLTGLHFQPALTLKIGLTK